MIDIAKLVATVATRETRPLVALKWAQTLDGQLADDDGKSKWFGSELLFESAKLGI